MSPAHVDGLMEVLACWTVTARAMIHTITMEISLPCTTSRPQCVSSGVRLHCTATAFFRVLHSLHSNAQHCKVSPRRTSFGLFLALGRRRGRRLGLLRGRFRDRSQVQRADRVGHEVVERPRDHGRGGVGAVATLADHAQNDVARMPDRAESHEPRVGLLAVGVARRSGLAGDRDIGQ